MRYSSRAKHLRPMFDSLDHRIAPSAVVSPAAPAPAETSPAPAPTDPTSIKTPQPTGGWGSSTSTN